MSDYEPLKLFNDSPLSDTNHDALNFEEYSEVIYESILGTDTPCTIGIFGEWGMGKTSMMKMSEKLIHDNDKYISVWFNAWQYEKEEHTIIPLIATIIKKINLKIKEYKDLENKKYEDEEQEKELKQKIKELEPKKTWLGNVGNALRSIVYGFSAEIEGDVPLLGKAKVALNGSDMVDRFEELMKDSIIEKSLYFDAYEKMENLSTSSNDDKIVVFIDDLDRCMPDNAVKLLENIKLFLSQKGFVFVLGVAREVVEGHLKKRYEEDFKVSAEHGEKYLDKIVQIPIIIPSHSSNLEELVQNMFGKIEDKSLDDNLKVILAIVLKEVDGNPRTLTRLINRIKLNSRISKKIIKTSKIEDNERLYYFAIACSLQEFYKDIYYDIAFDESYRKICLGEDINVSTEHEKLTSSLNKKNSVLKDLLKNEKTKVYFENWLKNDEIRKETVDFIKNNDVSVENRSDKNEWQIRHENAKRNSNLNLDELKEYRNIDDEYEFSKYLITNVYYDEFIKDDGYRNSLYWIEEGSDEYRINLIEKKDIKSYKDLYDEYEENFLHPFQPIVNVSWHEVKAFAKWLSDKSENYNYNLPTKEQFEYVSLKERVKDVKEDREKKIYKLFPWGKEWDERKCNNGYLRINNTTIVGLFSEGVSPFGVHDMSGNVWKWTDSDFDGVYKITKGGVWALPVLKIFSTSYEGVSEPDYRDDSIGFYLIRIKK